MKAFYWYKALLKVCNNSYCALSFKWLQVGIKSIEKQHINSLKYRAYVPNYCNADHLSKKIPRFVASPTTN